MIELELKGSHRIRLIKIEVTKDKGNVQGSKNMA